MIREQVIEWAKQASIPTKYWNDELHELCRLARRDMREQCAKTVERLAGKTYAEAIRNLEV